MTHTAIDDQPELLRVENLAVHFTARSGLLGMKKTPIKAVDGIDFELRPGETLGIVGESGSGKSTTGRGIMRLVEPTEGRVMFEGHSLRELAPAKFRKVRREIQIVFQDPYSSLNPRMTVRQLVEEPLVIAREGTRASRRRRVSELLDLVGLDHSCADRHPHALSGGQRQRVGIARALALNPRILVLDEPVSALDVSLQAQVVNLLQDLQAKLGLAYIFISHDLSVIRQVCHRVAILYLGRIVESGPIEEILTRPTHPYTQSLLSAAPIESPTLRGRQGRIVLKGDAASPSNPPSGCSFHPRCWRATQVCSTERPVLQLGPVSPHPVACHHPGPRRPEEDPSSVRPPVEQE